MEETFCFLANFFLVCALQETFSSRDKVSSSDGDFKPVTHDQVFVSKFELTLELYLLVCKAKPFRFSLTSAFLFKRRLLTKILTSCRNCWSVLDKKIEKLRVITDVILVFALMVDGRQQLLKKL